MATSITASVPDKHFVIGLHPSIQGFFRSKDAHTVRRQGCLHLTLKTLWFLLKPGRDDKVDKMFLANPKFLKLLSLNP